MQPRYAVVVTTQGNHTALSQCMAAVFAQVSPSVTYEVLIIGEALPKQVRATLNQLARKVRVSLSYCTHHSKHESTLRNEALHHTSAPILVFVQEECLIPSNWIDECEKGFRRYPHARGVGGYCGDAGVRPGTPEHILADLLYIQFGNYSAYEVYGNTPQASPFGTGGSVAYTREVLVAFGGFDEHPALWDLVDLEFTTRITLEGVPVLYLPVQHLRLTSCTWKTMKQIAFRRGVAEYYLSTRYELRYTRASRTNLFEWLSVYRAAFPGVSEWAHAAFVWWGTSGANYARRMAWYSKKKIFMKDAPREFIQHWKDGLTQEQRDYSFQAYEEDLEIRRARSAVMRELSAVHENPLVTIIIPFYNRESFITPYFVDALNTLEGHPSAVEIIFVDDGSTDHTKERLEALGSQLRFPMRVLTQENKGPAGARNLGMAHARGTYICFADSDIIVPRDWLSVLLFPFRLDSRIVLTGGKQKHVHAETLLDRWRDFSDAEPMPFYIGNRLTKRPYDFANMCVDRKRLTDAGLLYVNSGFVRGVWCEDLDYVLHIQKANMYSALVPMFVENRRTMTLKNFLDVCVTREKGMRLIRQLHTDIEPYVPYYFFVANWFGTLHMLWKVWRYPEPGIFFVGHVFHMSVNGKSQNLYLRLAQLVSRFMP